MAFLYFYIMKLSVIKANPNNPRVIKDDKFKKLVNSIKEFPKMMALRPMVINEDNVKCMLSWRTNTNK